MSRGALLNLAAVLALIAGSAVAGDAPTPSASSICAAPPELTALEPALSRVAARVAQRQPLTIVAVGSSSTQGVGASAPGLTYPSRLEAELKERFPDISIRVLNRGKGGEDAAEELARLDRDVLAEHPDLVIWQLGTNAVLRRDDLAADDEMIERGIARLRQAGSDVVLMDMQYAPRVIARATYAAVEQLLADTAKRARIGLFRRFAIMRYWQEAQPDGPKMIGPDGLHMTDQGYGCLAIGLAEAIAANWRSHEQTAPSASQIAHLAGQRHAAAPREPGAP
jgi:acyl-CoA thioesterase I